MLKFVSPALIVAPRCSPAPGLSRKRKRSTTKSKKKAPTKKKKGRSSGDKCQRCPTRSDADFDTTAAGKTKKTCRNCLEKKLDYMQTTIVDDEEGKPAAVRPHQQRKCFVVAALLACAT